MSATLLKNNKWFSENAIDVDFLKANEHLESYGPRHVPVSHALILNRFRDICEKRGLMLFNEQGALSKDGDRYMYVAEVESFTHKNKNQVIVSKRFLTADDHLLIIDDFLANGNAALGIIDLVNKAGATLEGMGFLIEKGFQNGGDKLRSQGIHVESLAIIDSLDDCKITLKQ